MIVLDENSYENARGYLLENGCEKLLSIEEEVTNILSGYLFENFSQISNDFNFPWASSPFWRVYAPVQRGHMPRGEAYPWGEVGEKVLEGYIYSSLSQLFKDVSFPGIPYGHDIRFLTDKAFIHIDVKSTGPTDDQNEVVSSPNQVTGDGIYTNEGIINSYVDMKGPRVTQPFRPELPPFYLINGKIIPVLTFYLKVVYSVNSPGHQPLAYIELVCVPNGLAFFVNPNYNESIPGILTPGKDDRTVVRKRTRIKLNPLSRVDIWRCQSFSIDRLTNEVVRFYR